MSEPTHNMINSNGLPDHESCEISLDEIKLRRNGDTRSLNISHVFNLADSIESMGLITSIAVDRDGYLIAGGHRLMALKLLNPTTRAAAVQKMICQERSRGGQEGAEKSLRLIDELRSTLPVISNFNFDRVGVNIYELSSAELPDKAIAIEIAENMIREDYSPREVFELYELLLIKGCFFREVLLSEIRCIKITLTSPHLSVRLFRFQTSTQIFHPSSIRVNTYMTIS